MMENLRRLGRELLSERFGPWCRTCGLYPSDSPDGDRLCVNCARQAAG